MEQGEQYCTVRGDLSRTAAIYRPAKPVCDDSVFFSTLFVWTISVERKDRKELEGNLEVVGYRCFCITLGRVFSAI